MRRATFSQVCQWIITAWSSVKESTITNGFLKAGLLRDAGSLPDAEAPPKRRAALIPRAPALGCTHFPTPVILRFRSVITHTAHFSVCFLARYARGERRKYSTPKRSLHGARQPWRSAALQRPVWTRHDEEDSASSRADLPREESDIESANERETECNEAILRRGHLRLIDKCGLFMYNFFFLLKISRCGLYIGAAYSPEFTVSWRPLQGLGGGA